MLRIASFLGLLGLFALSPSAFAQKERLISGDPDKVFQAAVEAVRERYEIVSVSREDRIIHFKMPDRTSMNRYQAVAEFALRPLNCGKDSQSARCSQVLVKLRVSGWNGLLNWGKGNSSAKDFFDEIEKRLASSPPAQKVCAASPVLAESPHKMAPPTPQL